MTSNILKFLFIRSAYQIVSRILFSKSAIFSLRFKEVKKKIFWPFLPQFWAFQKIKTDSYYFIFCEKKIVDSENKIRESIWWADQKA